MMNTKITLAGILEPGYPDTMEYLGWKHLAGTYMVKKVLVGRDFETLDELLDQYPDHHKVFFIPPGNDIPGLKKPTSIDFREYVPPEGDVLYVFGNKNVNMIQQIKENDIVVSIHMPIDSRSIMAICIAAVVLYVHG